MTRMIERMQGVTSGGSFGLPPAVGKVLDKVAEAITSVETSNPNAGGWMDRNRKVVIKANTQTEVVQTLTALGVFTVSKESALALIASGHKLPIADIDAALAKANVDMRDRIALKTAVNRFSLLKK